MCLIHLYRKPIYHSCSAKSIFYDRSTKTELYRNDSLFSGCTNVEHIPQSLDQSLGISFWRLAIDYLFIGNDELEIA